MKGNAPRIDLALSQEWIGAILLTEFELGRTSYAQGIVAKHGSHTDELPIQKHDL